VTDVCDVQALPILAQPQSPSVARLCSSFRPE
jgi:hypothetical protein